MDRERLFSEPKVRVNFPVDLAAEIRAKGKGAFPYPETDGMTSGNLIPLKGQREE